MNRWGLTACYLALTIWISCKKTDTESPSIQINFPSADTLFEAGTEILVSGHVSDNEQLQSVVIQLVDSLGGIAGSESFPVQGKESEFNFWFTAGDRYTLTGRYSIKVAGLDEAGNYGTDENDVHVTEVVAELLKVFMVTQENNPSKNSHLYSVNPNSLVATYERQLGNDVTAIHCDNRNQQLVFASNSNSRLIAIDPDHPATTLFDVPFTNTNQTPVSIALSRNVYAVGMNVPPYVQLFDKFGNAMGGLNGPDYPVSDILIHNNRIYCAVTSANWQVMRVECYDLNSRTLVGSYSASNPVEKLFLTKSGILLGIKHSGLIRFIDPETMTEYHTSESIIVFRINSKLQGAGNQVFCIVETSPSSGYSLMRYSVEDFSFQGSSVSPTLGNLGGEQAQDILWVGAGQAIHKYDPGAGQIGPNNPGILGYPLAFAFHWNK